MLNSLQYEFERREFALKLIEFDKKFYALFELKAENDEQKNTINAKLME